MAKQPRLGRVKTRLARAVGAVEATRAYRVMLQSLLRGIGNDSRWITWLAVSGVHEVEANIWPAGVHVVDQGAGDLGDRMQRMFNTLPPGPVVIVGSDIPQITPRDITQAFETLGSKDICAGPAPDGGYWLIGQSARARGMPLFNNVRWSSEHALADTLANAAGREAGLLRKIEDVDDLAGYKNWLGRS